MIRLLTALATILALYASADDKVAEYKGHVLYKSEIDSRIKSQLVLGGNLPAGKRTFDELSPEWRRLVITQTLQQKLLEEDMAKSPISQQSEYKQQLEAILKGVTVRFFIENTVRKQLTSSSLHKEYGEVVKSIKATEFLNISQILLKDDTTANKVLQDIKNKTITFEQAAKEHSIDKQSAGNGGNIGFVGKGDMPPELENAAYSLKVGALSDPIKTQVGWFLIKVIETKKPQVPEFKEIKAQLEQRVLAKLHNEYMQNLVNEKEVKFM
jgi:peptidyl-prolyl cis-trans isomerase C